MAENCANLIPLVRVFATGLQGLQEGFSRSDTLYALPILNAQGKPRPLPHIAPAIQQLLPIVRNRRDHQFLIPVRGSGAKRGRLCARIDRAALCHGAGQLSLCGSGVCGCDSPAKGLLSRGHRRIAVSDRLRLGGRRPRCALTP